MHPSPVQILVIILVVVLLFGGRRIASVGKDLGSGLRAFKDGLTGPDDDGAESPSKTSKEPQKGRAA